MKLSLRFIQKQLPEKEVLYMRGGSPAILCGQIRFWEEGRKCSRKCIYLISANSFVKCVRGKNPAAPESDLYRFLGGTFRDP